MANGTYIEYYPSAPISCRHRYSRLLTKNSVSVLGWAFVKNLILLPRTQSPERDVHQYYSLAGFSRAACNVFFNQRAEPYLFGLCRSDGEIRATKRHRRLEGSLQVHAVILSGYTETRRRSQSGSCGCATAKRIGTGGTKTGEKRDTDLEAEMGGNHRSCQHRRECRFSFRQQQGQDAGKG